MKWTSGGIVTWMFLLVLGHGTVDSTDPEWIKKFVAADKDSPEGSKFTLWPKLSERCLRDVRIVNDRNSSIFTTYSKSPMWQEQMFDSFGRIPSGITRAHIIWPGEYHQCLSLQVWKNTSTAPHGHPEPDIRGKYCLASLGVIVIPTPLRIGYCVPHTCSARDAQMIISSTMVPFRVFMEDEFCDSGHSRALDGITIAIICLFAFLGTLVVVATVYDFRTKYAEWKLVREQKNLPRFKLTLFANALSEKPLLVHSTACQFLLSFSAITNTMKILDTSNRPDSVHLNNLNGIKAISMMWVVVGHMFVMLNQFFAWKNGLRLLDYLKYISGQFVAAGEFAVDTFITMTGFLIVYIFFNEMRRNGGRFNLLLFYVHRLFRITPAFALVIAFMCGPLAYLAHGPVAPAAFLDQQTCRRVWWKSLLFILVYYRDRDKCLPQIWYLCIDMCFYALSPIFLLPLFRKPKAGQVLLGVGLVASILIPGMLIHYHDLGAFPAHNLSMKQREDYMYEVYNVPWGRMHAFLVGASFGYAYATMKDKLLVMPKMFVAFMWMVTAGIMLSIVYGVMPYNKGEPMEHTIMVIYGTFSRPAWAFAISWVITACALGYGGVANTILSWKVFVPFSRLSYSAYLVHFTVIGQMVAARKTPLYVDGHMMFSQIIMVLFETFFFSWLLTILIEAPVIRIENLLLLRANYVKTSAVTMGVALDKHGMPFDVSRLEHRKVRFCDKYTETQSSSLEHLVDMVESSSDVFWDSKDSHSLASEDEFPTLKVNINNPGESPRLELI